MQLELFTDIELDEKLKDRIRRFQKLVDESDEGYELVAVNKLYESVVVHTPDCKWTSFQTAIERKGAISCEYGAGGRDGFGTNLLIVDERFKGYESCALVKGNTLITCNVKELDGHLAEGWLVKSRGGVIDK